MKDKNKKEKEEKLKAKAKEMREIHLGVRLHCVYYVVLYSLSD